MDGCGLKDQVILVTGGARGLGRAYAERLVAEGAQVALHDGGVDPEGGSPNPAIVAAAAAEIGADILPISGLLTDRASCRRVVDTVLGQFGRIDGLIHNAGVVIWRDTMEVSEAEFARATAINHETAFWLCQAVLGPMRTVGYGRIVLTGSAWSLNAQPGADRLTLYCLSKAAQLGLVMSMSHDPSGADIKANLLVPVAKTRVFVRDVAPGELHPARVAGAALWLASPACAVTGQIVRAADGKISILKMSEMGAVDVGAPAEDPGAAGRAIADLTREVL